jgi:hypothetical protein
MPEALELVLDLVPERGAAQRALDTVVELRLRRLLVEADAEGDIVVDRHRERRRLLEDHADARAQFVHVDIVRDDVAAVEHDLAGGALLGIERVDPVEDAQQGRLAAARRADQRRDVPVAEVEVDVLQRLVLAVVEIEVLDGDADGRVASSDCGLSSRVESIGGSFGSDADHFAAAHDARAMMREQRGSTW